MVAHRIVERHRGQHGQLGRGHGAERGQRFARAMMARLAERDDVSSTIATAGTSTASRSPRAGFDNFADMNGAMIAFVPHATNGGALNVGGWALPLRFGPSIELQSGVLIRARPMWRATTTRRGLGLQGGFANPYGIRWGMMPMSAARRTGVRSRSKAISRTTYGRCSRWGHIRCGRRLNHVQRT
jgi:hypothetical protein